MDIQPIEHTNRKSGNRSILDEALHIYRNTILPEAQNPEKQILHWIDHSKDDLADQFRCFALKQRKKVVGYLQYSYFAEEHIFFFEYLCIIDKKKKGLAPSDAMKAIEDYIAQTYRPGFTIVFEVAHQREKTSGVWIPDKKLVDYFVRLGFRKLNFNYQYPVLQTFDGKTSYPADLMIMLPNKQKNVSASEMRTVLRCLYFKHYLRWDRPFIEPPRFAQREEWINELYARQVAGIGGNDTFGTTGDDKRSQSDRFQNTQPKIGMLLERLFGPKMPRILVAIVVAGILFREFNSLIASAEIALLGALLFCLGEDTDTSRKLFVTVLSHFRHGRRQS